MNTEKFGQRLSRAETLEEAQTLIEDNYELAARWTKDGCPGGDGGVGGAPPEAKPEDFHFAVGVLLYDARGRTLWWADIYGNGDGTVIHDPQTDEGN